MATKGIRQRQPPASVPVIEKLRAQRTKAPLEPKLPDSTQHPAGEVKHGPVVQFLRMCLFAAYFNGSIIAFVYTNS
jgi:lysocardiolipin and lysophospholipid acyltransferase